MADFDPTLTAALEAVTTQRDRVKAIFKEVELRVRRSQNVPFPQIPPPVPDGCSDAHAPRVLGDIKNIFNQVLDSIRDGSAEEASVRSSSNTYVAITNGLLGSAIICLQRPIPPLDMDSLASGWLQILSSFNGMSEKDRKKFSKHLDKKVRW